MFKFLSISCLAFAITAQANITVLTDRPQARFLRAAEIFESQTGQTVSFIEAAYPDLLSKMQAGQKADLIMAKDLVILADLKNKNLLQSLSEVKGLDRIHSSMKDPQWTALTSRVRTLVYNPNAVNPNDIETYSDLAKPEWTGRLCLRTAKADYNVALTGGLIATYGSAKAEEILSGWIQNLAADVFPNDTAVLEAIASGVCDVGIVNHYYLAQLLAQKPSLPVKIKYLNQKDAGVLTNGSAIGILAMSEQKELAQQFIGILLSDEIQKTISEAHYDFPAVQDLTPTTFIKDWGTFKVSPITWSVVGSKVNHAKELMTKVGYK